MLTKFGEVKKMKFHEDIIFKNHGRCGGESILRIMNLKGRIVKVHETEFSIIDPKMYKPDFVLEVTDKIYIIEFQSTLVDTDVEPPRPIEGGDSQTKNFFLQNTKNT